MAVVAHEAAAVCGTARGYTVACAGIGKKVDSDMFMHTRCLLIPAVLVAGLVSPAWGATNLLTNSGFEGPPIGAGWGSFWNVGFNDFFGGDAHASLFGDTAGNSGGFFQQGIPGSWGATYQLDLLNARIEANWDADLILGLEYYAADDTTKLGESLVLLDTATRLANGMVEGNVFSMQGAAVAGTVYVRPAVRFESVNPAYAGEAQANLFVFDTYLSLAPTPGEEALKNPGFADENTNGTVGDYWGKFGNADFNEFFGADNPHASFFADTVGNSGGVFQQAVLGASEARYRYRLENVRIEANFDGDLYFGLEYYGADDFAKLGETIVQIDTATKGDGLSFDMLATSVAGTVYIRPVVFFDNVATTGGTDRNVFVFEASLTRLVPGVNLLANPGFNDVDTNGVFGDSWGAFFNADFNDFWGGNPHASLFGDFAGNSGGVFQTGIPVLAETEYQLDLLNTRIEPNWDADLLFGLEYYAADDATKLGESLELVDTATRIANGTVDGNVFSMQATAIAGAVFVRPVVRFENVNPGYAAQAQANTFVFEAFMGLAPAPGDQLLKNLAFADANGDGSFGDYWGSFGNTGFNEFFGPGNAHASLFAEQIGNSGAVYQQAILGTPGAEYRLDLLNVRIEDNFDADLFFGLEYYGGDDFVKLGEAIVPIDTSTTGDGLSFDATGTAVAGTVYVRPIVFFDNVGFDGGTLRNAFIFATSLHEVVPQIPGDADGDGDVELDDYAQFVGCLEGPGVVPGGANCLDVFDFDDDNDVDLGDFAGMQTAFGGAG
ncbi:MAG: hypothetical protein GY842_26650 [bacterium]|nr:hypothetical protein [bacterium]